MRRSLSPLVLLALGAGVAASFLACGQVAEEPLPVVPDAEAPPTRRDAGGPDDVITPPLREVTTPRVIDLGNVGAGQEVTFEVPAGALGFNVVVEGTASDFSGIERITSPSGEIVHDAFMPRGGSHATSSVDFSFGPIVAASVPQSEAASANTPEPGTWTVRFGTFDAPPPLDGGAGGGDAGIGPATLEATARIQMGSSAGGFVGGRLDVRVYIPSGLRLDGKVLTATSAATDTAIERRMEIFFGALSAQVGIDRGEVTFHAAPAALNFVDSEASLVGAFAASGDRPDGEQALQLLLTNGIDFGGGSGAWGVAPGIPGAATRTGTVMSGIVLAIGDTPAVGDGLTILHEAGHFFGLNHTTEFAGDYADPLTDTPKCVGISIDDPSTLNACPDRYNIMFPAFYGFAGAQAIVSDAQRGVLRGSPIYKAYRTAADGTMAARPGHRGLASPGERVTLTKSGRALTPVEAWLSTSLCGHRAHAKLDPRRYVATHDRSETLAALRAAATSDDLPRMLRARAEAALRTLEARD